MDATAASVDEYLGRLSAPDRDALQVLRATIHAAAPGSEESISYTIPTFKYRGRPLIYFAAAKKHLAIYGTSAGTKRFTAAEPLSAEYVTGLVLEQMTTIDAHLAAKRRVRA
ncbi:MAG: DUF1801 domain-containing protein [Dehalococcoidia bacterium]|nr:DUF1801 domain-containing protein [Dehalococcoidia bacterium]